MKNEIQIVRTCARKKKFHSQILEQSTNWYLLYKFLFGVTKSDTRVEPRLAQNMIFA